MMLPRIFPQPVIRNTSVKVKYILIPDSIFDESFATYKQPKPFMKGFMMHAADLTFISDTN
jgi:predicted alternative tryptophan synthase beta-subunit